MDRKEIRKRFPLRAAAVLLCTALLWAVLFPVASSSNFRMDSDRMLHQPETAMNQYIRENRGGMVLLLRLFGLDRWDPVRSGVLYLLFLTLSGWLLCLFVRRLAEWKDRKLYLLFFLLYTLSPVWTFHAYFVLQSAPVGLGMLLCTCIAGVDSLFWSSERKQPWLRAGWEVFAVLLLGFCATVYQALIVHFAAVWAALMFCCLRKGRRVSVSALVLPVLRAVLAVAVYLLVSGLVRGGTDTAYLNGQILWGKVPFVQNCHLIIRSAGASLLPANSSRFSLYSVAVVCMCLIWYRGRRSLSGSVRILFTAACLALLLLPFAFNVLLGNASVPRTQFALQLTAALVPVCFLGDSAGRHRIFRTVLVLVLVVQAALTVRLYHTDNVRNRRDTEVADRICMELKDTDPELPVVFHGKLSFGDYSILTEKTDVYGRSFFEWVYQVNKPSSATDSALRLLSAYSGKQYKTIRKGPVLDRAMEEAASLPCYPEDGFVQKTDEYILISLPEKR